MDDELNKVNDAVNDAAENVTSAVENTVDAAADAATDTANAASQAVNDLVASAPVNYSVPEVGGKQKKKGGSFIIWVIIILAAAGYFAYTVLFAYKPKISVNGKEFSPSVSVKELNKLGFVLCDSKGKIYEKNPTLPGKTINQLTAYYIGIKESDGTAKLTGLRGWLGNFNSANGSDLSFYTLWYYPGSTADGVEVLINGQRINDITSDELEKAAKAAKLPFKEKEIKDFAAGKKDHLYKVTNKIRVTLDGKDGKVGYLEFQRDVKTKSK